MRILNFGSLNIDYVYRLDSFVAPGETKAASSLAVNAGGKGLNQSIALARAGGKVSHAGKIGAEGDFLVEALKAAGVDASLVERSKEATGHAIIQVIPSGENAIIVHAGANAAVMEASVQRVLATAVPGDWLLVQNETGATAAAIQAGKRAGLTVVFNPAPMTPAVREYPLQEVDCFILNETEAECLTGECAPDAVQLAMRATYPQAATVLTMGRAGAVYFDRERTVRHPGVPVRAIDTTAAGDTFIGFYLAERMRGGDPVRALTRACCAAAISVTRPGAAESIPTLQEVRADEEGCD